MARTRRSVLTIVGSFAINDRATSPAFCIWTSFAGNVSGATAYIGASTDDHIIYTNLRYYPFQ